MPQALRPVIGLNFDFLPAGKTHGAFYRLGAGYADAVLAVGGMPLFLPLLNKDSDLNLLLDQVDGFILTDGLDLDPRRQGQPMHHSVRPMPQRREDTDRALVRLLFHRQIPLLAIGAGMHLANVACGGTLFIHLPEEMPRAMPHCDPSCNGPHRHAVLLQAGTRLDEIYGGGEIRVNSNHHQAVRTVGSRFRVAAVAPDGVIEAIESTDPHWFCVGVQWQPACETASALDMQLFECFLQAVVRAGLRQPRPLALAG
ncbi:MAG: gamma-glutamyl-gamma-aminobutyrate hydrolase family protein [Gemmataceae bacterium]|nr:gamma-glutamyl-gamma-aminobutyrate hydrolase family protein [Gemmataceae bacterium]MCI0739232.1 gamma-glutamyl-gamma-aminobutyrate hydrolase family protein [Gemmataceae bacterium]